MSFVFIYVQFDYSVISVHAIRSASYLFEFRI